MLARLPHMGRPRALALEADASLRTLLRATLEVNGFDVQDVASARKALERLADPSSRPDVLVLEPVQGRRWTTEILHWVRQHPALDDLPIVVVTGRVGERERSTALSAGADAFVAKPFSPMSLAEIVTTLAREGRPPASETPLHERIAEPLTVCWGWEDARRPMACSAAGIRRAA